MSDPRHGACSPRRCRQRPWEPGRPISGTRPHQRPGQRRRLPEDLGAALDLYVANASCPGETSWSLAVPEAMTILASRCFPARSRHTRPLRSRCLDVRRLAVGLVGAAGRRCWGHRWGASTGRNCCPAVGIMACCRWGRRMPRFACDPTRPEPAVWGLWPGCVRGVLLASSGLAPAPFF